MTAPLLPQDVADHLAAAIQLSNRHIQLRFLEEAETLVSLQLPVAAVLVAGVVLESLVGQRPQTHPSELQQIEKWSQLRNVAVHPHGPIVTLDDAREMVGGVRQLLLRATAAGPRLASTASSNRVPGR